MATYYHGGSEIQSDGLQTLYLMNPGYIGYSDPQTPANMVFLNSAGNPLNGGNLSHPQQQSQHFVGIPLQGPPSAPPTSQDPGRSSIHNPQHDMPGVHGFMPRLHYNLWAASVDPAHQIPPPDMTPQLGLRRSMGPATTHSAQQGLSLSLSPQQPAYAAAAYRSEPDMPAAPVPPPAISPTSGDDMRISGGLSSSAASAVSNGIPGLQSVLMGSKYLKAAQQLLDEVVSVGKGIKGETNKASKGQMKAGKDPKTVAAAMDASGGGGETSVKRSAAELTTAERQELQMKKAKLVGMLDEVEQRYRQYHHQMQIVVSLFEAAAGFGSAKTYTALALQTISKQFRCLRDAIAGQIRATSKNLGEEECLGGKGEGSRMRLVDHHLRQQRALQQLGMIQHNAWRPQRGLPERSVSVLRAWLFEHFLHPYPKDSDKHMLAKQTGLTRSQVSNWFINARVRLWKPMVEEMYLEETKELEQNGSDEKTSKSEINEEPALNSADPSQRRQNSPTSSEHINNVKTKMDKGGDPNGPLAPNSTSPNHPPTSNMVMGNGRSQACFSLIGSPDTQASFHDKEGNVEGNRKKARNNELQCSDSLTSMSADTDMKSDDTNNREFYLKFANERQSRDGYSLITGGAPNNGGGGGGSGGGFGAFQIGESGRFDPEQFAPRFSSGNNGFSLTLGLPHCENLSLSGTQPTYLSNQNIQLGRRLEMSGEANDFCSLNAPSAAHSAANAYESINIQNRKRFAAQLLPDFVA
ncbi:BEL1-like homeodomain protein 1 [Magnolia sinica]|uniref:BEL1-like homeodomain protein 1 n=1 Tax=Magnolia sinica TaxID=86752 RepID=UPI002659964E|nr:BEL1-like homeodomain protein 1 [Magnolia sinica]XP_058087394.1 BEL1-like homeodomain protein 1 [Magnolia sinica]